MVREEEYGIAVVRRICVAGRCVRYALTRSRLWVEAPWSVSLLANPAGVLLTDQEARVNGIDVGIIEYVVVASLAEARRQRLTEAVLARLTREEAKTVARALLMATGLPRREAEEVAGE